MHLAEISTSENLHNGRPSTLLRSVPVENERGWSDGDLPCYALQKIGVWCNPPADSHGIRRKREKVKFRLSECDAAYTKLVDAGGPGSVRKCHGVTLADLGDVEGFGKDGEEEGLYAFQLADGVYRRKRLPQEEDGPLKFEELSNVDVSYATPKRVHTLVYTGEKWFPFADPAQQRGWHIDIKISSP